MDPRMYPTGHTYNDAENAETPAATDILSAIRGAAQKVTFSLTSLIALAKTTILAAVTGQIYTPTAITASGAISASANFVTLSSTTPKIEATIAAPVPGQFLVITQIDAGTAGHTVTLTAGTFDGSANVATFNAVGDTLVLFGVSATRYVVVENIGTVGLA